MRGRFATTALAVSIVLFFFGFLILCYCPGWYALAAAFAGVAAIVGESSKRFFGIIFLLASLALSASHWNLKERDKETIRKSRERDEQMERLKLDQSLPSKQRLDLDGGLPLPMKVNPEHPDQKEIER
jgi:membrane protein implicated in regulation of membrane protease activity